MQLLQDQGGVALSGLPRVTVSSLRRLQPAYKTPGLGPSETSGWPAIGDGLRAELLPRESAGTERSALQRSHCDKTAMGFK